MLWIAKKWLTSKTTRVKHASRLTWPLLVTFLAFFSFAFLIWGVDGIWNTDSLIKSGEPIDLHWMLYASVRFQICHSKISHTERLDRLTTSEQILQSLPNDKLREKGLYCRRLVGDPGKTCLCLVSPFSPAPACTVYSCMHHCTRYIQFQWENGSKSA